jgi:hypothetical protein
MALNVNSFLFAFFTLRFMVLTPFSQVLIFSHYGTSKILTLLQYLIYQTQFQAAGLQNRYLEAAGKIGVD